MTDYSELLKRADEATGLGWYIDPTPYAAALREQAGEIERLKQDIEHFWKPRITRREAERDTLASENAELRAAAIKGKP